MGKYKVYSTATFDKELSKYDLNFQARVEKIERQLAENPYAGDQLQYRHLREKRIDEKRVYFLVYDTLQAVLMVAISGKKDQQATINHIIRNFDDYQEYLEQVSKED